MPYPLPVAPAGVDEGVWEATVADVRGFCGWHVAPEVTETLTVDGPGSGLLVLPTLRLVDVLSITDDGAALTDPEWSVTGMVRAYCWTWKFRGVVAEITHGFEQWPADLLAVMAEMASTTASLAGVKAVTSGAHQVTFETSLRPSQRDVLGRYQLPFLA